MSNTDTVTYSTNSNGAVTATSSNASVATASISGNNITIEGKSTGSATITVNVAETSNFTAVSKTISVNVAQEQPQQTEQEFIETSTSYKWNYLGSKLPYSYSNGTILELNNNLHIFGGSKSSNLPDQENPNTGEYSEYDENTTNHYLTTNLNSWTKQKDLPVGMNCVVKFNNKLFALGPYKFRQKDIWISSDNGTNWTQYENQLPFSTKSQSRVVVFNNELHAFSDSYHYSSSDGLSWTKVNDGPGEDAMKVAANVIVFNNNIHTLSGTKHYVFNGSSWQKKSDAPFSSYGFNYTSNGIVVFKNTIHVSSSNGLWKSVDGYTWIKVNQNETTDNRVLASNWGDLFIYQDNLYMIGNCIGDDEPSWNTLHKNVFKLVIG